VQNLVISAKEPYISAKEPCYKFSINLLIISHRAQTGNVRKRALHIRKRALHIRQKSTHILTRALLNFSTNLLNMCCHAKAGNVRKRALRIHKRTLHIRKRAPLHVYSIYKEPRYTYTRYTLCHTKIGHIPKQPFIFTKEHYISAKEPCCTHTRYSPGLCVFAQKLVMVTFAFL